MISILMLILKLRVIFCENYNLFEIYIYIYIYINISSVTQKD